mgnify:CR=1 FL=1
MYKRQLYDLLDPVYIVSAPFTFLSKFAMGFVCGGLAMMFKNCDSRKKSLWGLVMSAAVGQIVYIFLYLLKTYVGQILAGAAHETALTATATNAITSSINAVLAVIISVPLYCSIKTALKSTYFAELIVPNETRKINWTVVIAASVVFIGISVGAIYLAS